MSYVWVEREEILYGDEHHYEFVAVYSSLEAALKLKDENNEGMLTITDRTDSFVELKCDIGKRNERRILLNKVCLDDGKYIQNLLQNGGKFY